MLVVGLKWNLIDVGYKSLCDMIAHFILFQLRRNFSFRCGRKTPKGKIPYNQVGSEHLILMQSSSLRWDSNWGP